jgi:hypothetical protein
VRALVIDDEAKQKVQRVRNWAEQPAHYYRPRKDARVPGDDYRFVVHLNSYRCVFTISEDGEGKLWRHLSMSVPSSDYPNPFAVYSVAELFGFTGWNGKSLEPPGGWVMRVDKDDHCIALGQPYEKAEVVA